MVEYKVEIYDTWGRRIACFDEVPLLEVTRRTPDRADSIRGMLPAGIADLGHGYGVRVFVSGQVFCEATVVEVAPEWSDRRKLILDRYVHFHEVIPFEAERPARAGNTQVSRAYMNRPVSAIAKDAINSALGQVHYLVNHAAYPDGAEREYQKFLGRKLPENELEIGGIDSGQWVGADRIDASGAYAKDGDTIAGIEVDGEPWPDLRLMLIDAEETTRNSHAESRHPEVADWTNEQYAASGYKIRAEAAKAFLEDLINTRGIDFIELNPHRDASGVFDDRVDAYGRYIGLVYGDGQCFDAALVEKGLADVYLYEDGRFLVPEMELKDFFSYPQAASDSVESSDNVFANFDVKAGVFEVLTALAYAADGYLWSADPDLAVHFGKAERPHHVLFFNPVEVGVTLGSDSQELVNIIYFEGNPFTSPFNKTYTGSASIDEYGAHGRGFHFFSISVEQDADTLAQGLLNDLAYPVPAGSVLFFHGNADVRLGDIIELRDGPLRRLEREIEGEWGDRFTGRLVGQVQEVAHKFYGRRVSTTVHLTSPLRSVESPLTFMVRSQPGAATLFQFRLDNETVGVDMGYHLD